MYEQALTQALAATEGIAESEARLWIWPGLRIPLHDQRPVAPPVLAPTHWLSPTIEGFTGTVGTPTITKPTPASAHRTLVPAREPAPKAVWAARQADGGTPVLLAAAQAGIEIAQLILEQLPVHRATPALLCAWLAQVTSTAKLHYRAWQDGTWPNDPRLTVQPVLPFPEPQDPSSWILLGFVEYQARPPTYGILEKVVVQEEEDVEDSDNPQADLGDDPQEPGSINPLLEGLSPRTNDLLISLTSFRRFDWDVVDGEVEASAYDTTVWPLGGPQVPPTRSYPKLPQSLRRGEWSFLQNIVRDEPITSRQPKWHQEVIEHLASIDPIDEFVMDQPRQWYVRQASGQARLVPLNTKHQLPPYSDANGELFTMAEAARNLNALAKADRTLPTIPFDNTGDDGLPRPDGMTVARFPTEEPYTILQQVYHRIPITYTGVHRGSVAHQLLRMTALLPLDASWAQLLLRVTLQCVQPLVEEDHGTYSSWSRLLDGDDEYAIEDWLRPDAWYHQDSYVTGGQPWAQVETVRPHPTKEGMVEVTVQRERGPATLVGERVGLLGIQRLVNRARYKAIDPGKHGAAGELIAPIILTLTQWGDHISGNSTKGHRSVPILTDAIEGKIDLWSLHERHRTLLARDVHSKEEHQAWDDRVFLLRDTVTTPWIVTTLAPCLSMLHWGLTFHNGRFVRLFYTPDAIWDSQLPGREAQEWVRLGGTVTSLQTLFSQRRRERSALGYEPQSWDCEHLYKLVSSVEWFTEDVLAGKPLSMAVCTEVMTAAGYPNSTIAKLRQNLKDSPGLRMQDVPGFEWVVPHTGPSRLLCGLGGTWPHTLTWAQFLSTLAPHRVWKRP